MNFRIFEEQVSKNKNINYMKKILIMALAALFGSNILAQDQSVIDRINKGEIVPSTMMYWITKDDLTNEFLKKAEYLTQSDLDHVSEMAEREIVQLNKVIETMKKIIGNETKQSKIDKKLAKYFDDPAKAMELYLQTVEMKARAQASLGAVNAYKGRAYHPMPEEMLTSFHYSSGNGFAGWSVSIVLNRNKEGAGGVLKFEEKRMMHRDSEREQKPRVANVDDSVFVKVDNLIKEGHLYDEANYYHPYLDVTDGTNWSVWMCFGKTDISTGGYMAGPNHSNALREILKYINEVIDELCPTKKED